MEYEALGQSFRDRGRRLGPQIELLRRLWTEDSVTQDGPDDRITGAGLAPHPVQRPIPVWVGGQSDPAYRRIGRLADGWFPQLPPGEHLDRALGIIATAATDAGREPATIGMEGRVNWQPDHDRFVRQVERWRSAEATHIGINTMGAGLASVDDHIAALATAAQLIGVAG
ncbi:MAG TPA: LLM class flavin-dependent oxidoreductase [Jiangellaceae bacterium]|nr:LLM class flavin-dependent oxidoreductase [Jiangellaceae bacterium]